MIYKAYIFYIHKKCKVQRQFFSPEGKYFIACAKQKHSYTLHNKMLYFIMSAIFNNVNEHYFIIFIVKSNKWWHGKLLSGKVTLVKIHLLLSTSAKTFYPYFTGTNFIQMGEQDFTVTFEILKTLFLLYIARYWCTFCCKWYCMWGTPLVFNSNHHKLKNIICSWN